MSPLAQQPRLPADLASHRFEVRRQLAGVRRRLRLHLFVDGLFWVAAVAFVLCLASLVADWYFRFTLPTRLLLVSVAGLALLVVLVKKVVEPLTWRLADLDLAAVIDRRRPGVAERMANVLQLPTLLEGEPLASPSMIRAAVAEQARELAGWDLGQTLNLTRRRWLVGLLLVMSAAAGTFAAVSPRVANLWFRRWVLGSDVRWPQQTYLNLVGLGGQSRLVAPRGEIVVLQVDARPKFVGHEGAWRLDGRGAPLVVETPEPPASQVPGQVRIQYRASGRELKRDNFVHYSAANFRYELPPLVEPVEFEVLGGDDWFGPLRVEPIDRPAVAQMLLAATVPGDARPQTHKIGQSDSQLSFLPKTRMELKLIASEPLRSAEFLAKDQPSLPLKRVDDRTWTLGWEMKDAVSYELKMIGSASGLASKPYFVSIGLLSDREPRVNARSTGVGRRITPSARVPLVIHALDDFGLAELGIEMELSVFKDQKPETTTKQLEAEQLKPDAQGKWPEEIERTPTLALRDYGLVPGMAVKLRARATDRSVLGARKGYSRWLSFQVVTPEELFYEVLVRQREQRAKFAAALAAAKTQDENIAALESAEQTPALVRAHQVTMRQVSQIATQLDQTLQEMTLNDLGSPQARELLENNIIKGMRTLHDDLLGKQRVQLDVLAAAEKPTGSPRDQAKQMQEQIVARMQTLLNQMSQWESFIDVVNQLRQVIKLQGQVLESTRDTQKTRTDELFDK